MIMKLSSDKRNRGLLIAGYVTMQCYLLFALFNSRMALAEPTNLTAYSNKSIPLTEASNGASIKVVPGAILNIFLKLPPEEVYKSRCHWSKVTISDASILREIRRAVLLPAGVTAGFFRAIQPGVVQIDSIRQNCSAGGVTRWHVEIRVVRGE